jgi:2'-5' RNA ligase
VAELRPRRLFVALDPPEPVRRRIAQLQAELRRVAGRAAGDVRWVEPAHVHLTLQFLGAVPAERVPTIEAALRDAAAAAAPLGLEVKGAGGFPSARSARIVWLGVSGDVALGALVAEVGRRLSPLGFAPEARPFAAHLTVGRSRDRGGVPGLAGALAAASGSDGTPWRATEVVLFESHLSPAGARYEAVARFALGG